MTYFKPEYKIIAVITGICILMAVCLWFGSEVQRHIFRGEIIRAIALEQDSQTDDFFFSKDTNSTTFITLKEGAE